MQLLVQLKQPLRRDFPRIPAGNPYPDTLIGLEQRRPIYLQNWPKLEATWAKTLQSGEDPLRLDPHLWQFTEAIKLTYPFNHFNLHTPSFLRLKDGRNLISTTFLWGENLTKNLLEVNSLICQDQSLQKISDNSFSNSDIDITPFRILTTPQFVMFNHRVVSTLGRSIW
jgi:hypothetical protein